MNHSITFESPKKAPAPTYENWVDKIILKTIDGIEYGILPAETCIFRARRPGDPLYSQDIAWYGNYGLCSTFEYGTNIFSFTTCKELKLINMGSMSNLIQMGLRNSLSSFIIENTEIIRESEYNDDFNLAKKLQNEQKNYDGWFHFDIKANNIKRFHDAEIMLFYNKHAGEPEPIPLDNGLLCAAANRNSINKMKRRSRSRLEMSDLND